MLEEDTDEKRGDEVDFFMSQVILFFFLGFASRFHPLVLSSVFPLGFPPPRYHQDKFFEGKLWVLLLPHAIYFIFI